MNSILKGILSTVVTIEDDDKVVQKQQTSNPATNTNLTQKDLSQSVQTDFHPMQTVAVGDTQKYKTHFQELLKEANLPGNDYYELSLSLDALTTAIPDERTRFIAAYTPLSLNGLTKDKVNSSAKSYLAALDQDAANFSQSLEQKRVQDVDSQKQQIDANNKKIQDLTAQIQQLNNDNLTIQQKVFESEQKINSSKSGYEFELNNVKDKINNDLIKFNQIIQ